MPGTNWLDSSPINLKQLPVKEQLTFAIILNSVSFCFWNLPKWKIEYRGLIYDGSWAMIAAFSKAKSNGFKIFSFDFLSNLSESQFNEILGDENELTFKMERLEIIKEVSKLMMNKFQGNPLLLIDYCGLDALEIIDFLITEITSFRDYSDYNDHRVFFNKRAQLLASDINNILISYDGKGLINSDKITACADYKIPYILREFNVLEYSEELAKLIEDRVLIDKHSQYEIEIRAFSIWAIEELKKEYLTLGISYSSSEINDFLWLISQIKSPNYRPYHLTKTISY